MTLRAFRQAYIHITISGKHQNSSTASQTSAYQTFICSHCVINLPCLTHLPLYLHVHALLAGGGLSFRVVASDSASDIQHYLFLRGAIHLQLFIGGTVTMNTMNVYGVNNNRYH